MSVPLLWAQVIGIEDFATRLDRIGKKAEGALKNATRRALVSVRGQARDRAPNATGALSRALGDGKSNPRIAGGYQVMGRLGTWAGWHDTKLQGPKYITVGKKRYFVPAGGKEPDKYGFVQERRRPFLLPLFQANKTEILRIYREELNKEILRHGG